MTFSENDEMLPPRTAARPGILDAQLSLTDAFIDLTQPIAKVIKRDGRSDAFDAHKIADSIERAGTESQEVDWNTSCSLASAVVLYIADATDPQASVGAERVHEAVARVLREMGYDRTARCYLRYRDVRLRLHSSERALGEGLPIEEWDWDQTAAELVRDAALDSEAARAVVCESERRLRAGGFSVLTAPLVREILSAIARERGLEGLQQTFGQIEISQAEVARILSAPSEGAPNVAPDPEGSGTVLAARMKQAFALASVYSPAVSEAHARGDIYLHDLGTPDRLCTIAQPLERLKRFGMETAAGGHTSSPAREPDTLIAHAAGQTAALRPYFSGPVTWDALNFSFAPFVHQLDEDSLRDLAKVLLYEFAYRTLSAGSAASTAVISLHWDVPPHMHGVELAGPGGAYTERTCADYLDEARDFAMAILAEYTEIARQAQPIPVPALEIHLTPSALKSPKGLAFLERAVASAQRPGRIGFRCESESALLPHAGDPLSALRVVVNRITINLPRAAHRHRDEGGLLAELDRMLEMAVQGHIQKRTFIKGLIGKQRTGPLGLLDARQEGRPMVDLECAAFVIGLTGLNECVRVATDRQLHEHPEAARVAEVVMQHLHDRCREWSQDYGIDLSLEPSTDDAPGKRFAAADIAAFGDVARQLARPMKDGSEASYTSGTNATDTAALSLMERVRVESRLHPYLHENAVCNLRLSSMENDFTSITDLIQKAFLQTSCRGIVLE